MPILVLASACSQDHQSKQPSYADNLGKPPINGLQVCLVDGQFHLSKLAAPRLRPDTDLQTQKRVSSGLPVATTSFPGFLSRRVIHAKITAATKCDNDGSDHAGPLRDSQLAEDPSSEKTAQDAKNDVDQNPIASSLHSLAASQPAISPARPMRGIPCLFFLVSKRGICEWTDFSATRQKWPPTYNSRCYLCRDVATCWSGRSVDSYGSAGYHISRPWHAP